MSSSAFVTIDGYPLFFTYNYFEKWYFKPSDRQIRIKRKSELNPLIWGNSHAVENAAYQEFVYRISAGTLKRRLRMDGFSIETLEQEYEIVRKSQMLNLQDAIEYYGEHKLGEKRLKVLKESSYKDWMSALRFAYENKLTLTNKDQSGIEIEEIVDQLLDESYDPFDEDLYDHEYSLPIRQKEFVAVALLEFVKDDAECLLDVTDLVEGGWTDQFLDMVAINKGSTAFFDVFQTSALETLALINLSPSDQTLARLLYANLITAMETYLSDTFKKAVVGKEAVKRKYVESHAPFKKDRIDMADIFKKFNSINSQIIDAIDTTLFHDIPRVQYLFRDVLDTHFEESSLDKLKAAVRIRHDIVHRNGKSIDGKSITISMNEVKALYDLINSSLSHLDKQIIDALLVAVDEEALESAS